MSFRTIVDDWNRAGRGSRNRGGFQELPQSDTSFSIDPDAGDSQFLSELPTEKASKPPTIAFHAAWIYFAIIFMLFFATAFYIPWGMRQESDEPLYGLISYTLNQDTKWHHRWGASMVIPIGLGILSVLALINFLKPNKGTEWGFCGNDAKGTPEYTKYNHLEVWIMGTHVCVLWFMVLLILGMTDLNTLVFASLLAFASEALFAISQYITHFEDKYTISNLASTRAAWQHLSKDLQTIAKRFGSKVNIWEVPDDELEELINKWYGGMQRMGIAYSSRYEPESEEMIEIHNLCQSIAHAQDMFPAIKKFYPFKERRVQAVTRKVPAYSGNRKSGKGKISGTFFLIGSFIRIAIWTLASYAFAYTQRDFDNAQYAAGVIMLVFDFALWVKHSVCLGMSIWGKDGGLDYYRRHGPKMIMLALMSIGIFIPLLLGFYHEGSVPGAY